MPAITLATYAVRIRKSRGSEPQYLSRFDGTNSFLTTFTKFLDELADGYSHDKSAQTLQQAASYKTTARRVYGQINVGEYGYVAKLVSAATLKDSYTRLADDAELIPFYYLLSAPDASKTATFVVQRYGGRGIYTEFSSRFRSWFRDQYPDHTIEFTRLVPAAVIRHLLNGHLKEIEFTAYEMPSDLTDQVRAFGNVTNIGELTIAVKAKRNSVLTRPAWLQRVLENKIKLVELSGEAGLGDDRVKITVEWEGRRRIVDFHRPESIAPYIDVSKSVMIGPDGHPILSSIHDYSMKLVDDLESELGVA
jgi:hypothetical protein